MSELSVQPQQLNLIAVARRLRQIQLASVNASAELRAGELASALQEILSDVPPADRSAFLDSLYRRFSYDVPDAEAAEVSRPTLENESTWPLLVAEPTVAAAAVVTPPAIAISVDPPTPPPTPQQLTDSLCAAVAGLPNELRRRLADQLLSVGFLPSSPDLPTLPLESFTSPAAVESQSAATPTPEAISEPEPLTPSAHSNVAVPIAPVAPIDPNESAALAAIAQRLGLPVEQLHDRARLLQLLEHLLDLSLAPDHLIWELWSRVAPRSGVRRSTPGTLREDARRFVAGGASVGRGQIAADVAELRGLILSAVNALADAPRSLAAKLREKLAPPQIEQAVKIEGSRVWVPSTADTACWRRFVELFARIEAGGGLEQQCQDLIIRTVEAYHGKDSRSFAPTRPAGTPPVTERVPS